MDAKYSVRLLICSFVLSEKWPCTSLRDEGAGAGFDLGRSLSFKVIVLEVRWTLGYSDN